MKPRPDHQRRQAHRQRKAFARALHQLRTIKYRWMARWHNHQRPAAIKLPRMVRHRKRDLYRGFMS